MSLLKLLRYMSNLVLAVVCVATTAWASASPLDEPLEIQKEIEDRGVRSVPIGVTRKGTTVWMGVAKSRPGIVSSKRRLVIVAGLSGPDSSSKAVLDLMARCTSDPVLCDWDIAVVPLLCPDASIDSPLPVFPPDPIAYQSLTQPESQYLWRRLAIEGFDALIEVRAGERYRWFGPGTSHLLAQGELAAEVAANSIANTGTLPGWRLEIPKEGGPSVEGFAKEWVRFAPDEYSPARKSLLRRAERSPMEIARSLERHYGHKLEPVEYIQATAVLARLRLSGLLGDDSMRNDVVRIASKWLEEPTLDGKSSGSHFAGHLLFAELARTTGDSRYIELVKRVADLGFESDGQPRDAMPTHSEMSDAVFMGTPILVEAGVLTQEDRFYQMALRHLQFMLKLNLRSDGLHRHSPLDATAWGRGNGFPALGLALCLDRMPGGRPERPEMLEVFQRHMQALLRWQSRDGMWHQVIDHYESYAELTATCMVVYAMLRGVDRGWLDPAVFNPAIERAWHAIRLRIDEDGGLFDVCTGTGKQKSLRDYLDRQAIVGRDARGGAMALLVAVEFARREALSSR